jgi:uncharacterized protein with PIN domain
MPVSIWIRFYEELNDFLPSARRKKTFDFNLFCSPSIKDIIESLGVPHAEVDLIVVNGQSVSFNYRPKEGDMVSVYPVFESLDISKATHLRPKPLRITRFILDVHLGKLARYLRMLGFDSLYRNDYDDPEIVALSKKEKRIILTRDVILLKNNDVTHGLWIRSQKSSEQVKEVICRLNLHQQIKPFDRCMECNGQIVKIEKNKILDQIEPGTKANFDIFYRCRECHKVYWNGSHFEKMQVLINSLKTAE